MDMTKALQNLLEGKASEEDVELLKRMLVSGELSIGGNINNSVLTVGSGNNVQVIQITTETLDRLKARPMLGNLDRDLTAEEISAGLRRLDKLLLNRAPVQLSLYKDHVGRLRSNLKTETKALSESARKERVEALAAINSICVEAVDVSFNGLALGEAAPDYDARSPFRGLESFRPKDSEFFFGREALTQKLLGKIKAHSFLAVLGASGSGKSSLVMAGVIPALDLDYIIFRPGTKPLDELESARGKPLIVVDQFEELFTLTRDESMRVDFIARLLDESSRAKIILTLRSDFLAEVGAYRTLSAEIQNYLEIVPPMDLDELRRAMEGQAGATGLRFEADLSQQILDDVAGEPGAMPLLQHTLWELWNCRHGRNLRASEYRAFGGVKQAITSTAEQVYAECSKPEQDALRDIFVRLTRLDDNDEGRDTRRRVPLGDLIPSGRDAASISLLLDKLANARLIVKTVNEEVAEVEVAHEALIRHWERLKIWLNEDRDALRLRESVSESAKEWERSGRHESLLNSRWVKLDEALLLMQDSHYRLTDVEQMYLKGCAALRNREQRERERRLRYSVFASFVAAVIFLVLGGFGLIKSNESNVNAQQAENNAATAQANADVAAVEKAKAEEQAKIAKARELVAKAQLLSNSDPRSIISLLLSIESMRFYRTREADTIIQKGIEIFPRLFLSSTTEIYYAGFSNDSKLFVYQDEKLIVHIWDLNKQKEISKAQLDYAVNHITISPDNDLLLIDQGYDKGSFFYTIKDGENIFQDIISSFSDGDIYFSPDGSFIIIDNFDGYLHFLNSQTGDQVFQIICDPLCTHLSYTPNKENIIASDGSTIKIWDGKTGKLLSLLDGFQGLNEYILNSEESIIYVSEQNGELSSWNVSDGSAIAHTTIPETDYLSLAVFPSHEHEIYITAFGVDDKVWLWLGGDAPPNEFNIPKEFSPGSNIFIRGFAVTYLSEPFFILQGSNGLTIGNIVVDGTFVRLDTSATIYSIYSISGDGTKLTSREQFRSNFLNVKNTITGTVEKIFPDYYGSSMYFSADGNWLLEHDDSSPFQLWSLTPSYIQEDKNDDNLMNQEPRLGNLNQEGIVKLQQSITELQNVNIHSASVSDNGLWAVIVVNNFDPGEIKTYTQVWDINTHQLLSNLDGDYLGASFIGPDDKYIITSDINRKTHLFIWKTDELIDEACLHVTRNLTRAEWQQYIGDAQPYQAVCPNLPIEP